MFLKKPAAGVLLALAMTVGAHGATVSCMVIETGIRSEIPTAASSRIWEDALLEAFFETGHIVSNAPILRVAEKPRKNLPDEARTSLEEALEGGAEFFVVAVLEYRHPDRTGPEQMRPHSISLRLFKTAPCRFLYAEEYALADIPAAEKDEPGSARSLARGLVDHLRD
jgi:hypothetical protein